MAGVQSIERAFAILRALAVGPAGVTGLAERVALPKSTVARLLSALESEGAVAQDGAGGEYRLGEGLSELVGAVAGTRSLVATARPFLHGLAEAVGETAGVAVVEGRSIYYLDHATLDSDVQVRDWTGEYAPLHLVPSGLVYLAFDSRLRDAYLRDGAASDRTPVEHGDLRDRLAQVRSAGYAWVYEEFADGINSVAAPVCDDAGDVIAAVHIHGPAYRFPDPERTHDLGLLVMEAARGLAQQLR